MMNLPRFILVVEQLVNNWSLDPQRKEPVRVSTIPRNPNSNSRKSSGKTSSTCGADVDLVPLWIELIEIARIPSELSPAGRAVFPGYLCCTCPIGIEDDMCKHTLLLMETEQMIYPLLQPLEPRKKRGRRKKIGRAFEFV
uniref:SWIM-type domain-containing protein n=1 Tax=Ditylenchus dipsaci TaxID=166011 RepID=A0A915EHA2_9BILA